ncbi:MAG: pyridoxamine 5'-phosphate oxidase [Nocardioides sp.]
MNSGTPVDVASLRRNYSRGGLVEADLLADPVEMFRRWLADAIDAELYEPNAMVVATVSATGQPSARMVLLKGVDERGFVFFTNLNSRKGQELRAESRCSLLFPWHPLERQVRADGLASLVSREEVEAYFATRPRGSMLGAWASRQSQVVAGREDLARSYADAEARYRGDVPVPEEWGGFRVVPREIEFWQGRPGRMHDRLVYRRLGEGWRTQRLAP